MKKPIREIEVKAKITNKRGLLRRLKKLKIKLSRPVIQNDVVFLPVGTAFKDIKQGTVALRIRKQNKKTLLTMKQRQEVELSSLEKETEISNSQQMIDIIKILGFYEWIKIDKTRRKAKYKNYEICIDDVKKLGSYIEVEKLTDEDSFEVQEELFLFLESLGIKRENREKRGYDTLMHYLNK